MQSAATGRLIARERLFADVEPVFLFRSKNGCAEDPNDWVFAKRRVSYDSWCLPLSCTEVDYLTAATGGPCGRPLLAQDRAPPNAFHTVALARGRGRGGQPGAARRITAPA